MRLWLSGPRLPFGLRAGVVTAPVRPPLAVINLGLNLVIIAAVLAIAAGAAVLFELVTKVIPAQLIG